ncbi:hypothetical protein CH063_08961 [Colletotrichum higginsianum]|uniref:Uncharacterized protein n=1 Tax=Colletotrichum higginsianum (strain IMI 349063) TaxID=759273 RepID=H1VBT6_COLHI|nr:hypothetical protein CH63R_04864 [Colletotrichum higginsianum IMI 349063]OBR12568.1 hypothetical protein CH63R_04864 [Colletotrichum higginsianum IMI 349063]GJC94240.1 hypothetical protein ColKHC_03066 [Colletotrichum higginsianum]CCF37689.1 hypothetical protein CH063_08961 [Colletotrichum higginsianum]
MEEPYNPVRKDGTNTNDPFDKVKYKEKEKLWSNWGTRIGSGGDKPGGLGSRAVADKDYSSTLRDGKDSNDPFDQVKYKELELLPWGRRAVELDAREPGPDDAESATGPPPTKETSSNSNLGRGVEGAEVPESVERYHQESAFGFETGHYSVPGRVAARDFV